MSDLFYLVAAYGICFGLMNDKASVVLLVRRVRFIDQMFDCAYCTGFHCGWFVRILQGFAVGFPADQVALCAQVLVWGFASAAFCYVLDAVVKLIDALFLSEGDRDSSEC